MKSLDGKWKKWRRKCVPLKFCCFVISLERDLSDSQHKNVGSATGPNDATQKMQELKNKIDEFKQKINQVNGIGYTKDEQLARLESLKKQLVLKRELLAKYKHGSMFKHWKRILFIV